MLIAFDLDRCWLTICFGS